MKLGDYEFTIGTRKDLSLADVLNTTQTILNDGRYQMRIVNTVPNWVGDDGEHLLYVNGTTVSLYVYSAASGSWQSIQWNPSTNGPGSTITNAAVDKILDAAGKTGIYTEFVANEQTLRFYINGVYVFSINVSGISINSDFPLSFNGLNGNTYMKYNSTSGYLEFYVGGTLRVQM